MKIKIILRMSLFAVWSQLAVWSTSAQTILPFGSFQNDEPGLINGQEGWTALGVSGTSVAKITAVQGFSETKVLYLYDGDGTTRPRIEKDFTSNATQGEFDFYVMEDQSTAARDFWRIDFFNIGSGGANFSLLSGPNSISLRGASGSVLASIDPSTTSYNPAKWNNFRVIFNNTTKGCSIYLNGSSAPIFNLSNPGTTWSVGHIECSVAWRTASGQGVYFARYTPGTTTGVAGGTTGNKLLYAPPTLVAPTTKTASLGFSQPTFSKDEDAIVILPEGKRTDRVKIVGGRNVQVIGGDMGNKRLSFAGQTASVFLEGLKFDMGANLPVVNGVRVDVNRDSEQDAIGVSGVDPGTPIAPDFYVQNTSILGVHGMHNGTTPGVGITSMTYTGSNTYEVVTAKAHGLVKGNNFVCGALTDKRFNNSYQVTQVISTTKVKAIRSGTWYAITPALVSGNSATGGYLWSCASGGMYHSDGYQLYVGSVSGISHFYKVTIDSNYQCFIGGHRATDEEGRGLEMNRVNMRVNNIWPQDYSSSSLYIRDGGAPYPVTLTNVYLTPRPGHTLSSAVYPAPGTVRVVNGVTYPIGSISTNNGQTLSFAPDFGVKGFLNYSPDGHAQESGYLGKDYADLTVSNPPGSNYVSPGYSSMVPLKMSAITLKPVNADGTVSPSSTLATGGIVTRLDVEFNGARGYIIDLRLTNAGGGPFALIGRNLVTTGKLSAGSTYTVTVSAVQHGDSTNAITKNIIIKVK